MLMANITDKAKMVAAKGNFVDITADVCFLIAAVYQKFDDDKRGNMLREMFRKALIGFLTNEDSLIFEPMEGVENESSEVSEK